LNMESFDPILLSFPEQFETERLVIRAPQWGDGPAVNEAIHESVEALRPWMPWAQQLPSQDESEINIRKARLKFLERSDLRLLFFHKQSGQLIGSSGLHRIHWPARRFEIGYWVRTSQSGQGYVTEAVAGITQFAVQELQAQRVEIRCDSMNRRSRAVAERLGFTQEAILRFDTCNPKGELRDTLVFAKVRGRELLLAESGQ
jgi:ribosomal-protein-serine acetyltransferase